MRLLVLVWLVLSGALVWLAPPSVWAKEKIQPAEKKSHKVSEAVYKELDLFTKILSLAQSDYVEEPDGKELVYGAIRGMLSTLDPHSLFMTPDVYRELKVDTEGRFGGIGIEVTVKDNILTVVTAIEGSPAYKAGVHAGDRILKIDGISTKEMNLTDAVQKMRGRRNSKLNLTLGRIGLKEPMEVSLSREIIRVKSVRWEVPEEGYGYVRIVSFQEDTAEDLRKALNAVEKKSKIPLKGLILDLRNNPGGLLDEAVDVSDLFLDSGTIVTTASRNHEVDKHMAKDDGNEPDYPIVVLVNGGSASAAEIVAGALQDQKRAVLLGTQTFGKGTVQTIYELGDGAALKLTVAKYYTPKGRSIQAEGIHPDMVVEAKSRGKTAARDERLREKDLNGHLDAEKHRKEKRDKKEKKPGYEPNVNPATTNDYQKSVALQYLKSLGEWRKE